MVFPSFPSPSWCEGLNASLTTVSQVHFQVQKALDASCAGALFMLFYSSREYGCIGYCWELGRGVRRSLLLGEGHICNRPRDFVLCLYLQVKSPSRWTDAGQYTEKVPSILTSPEGIGRGYKAPAPHPSGYQSNEGSSMVRNGRPS